MTVLTSQDDGCTLPSAHADQRDPAGLQHVAAIAQLERFHHALLDEQDGEPARAANGGDRFADELDDARPEALRRLVEQQEVGAP